MKKPTVSAAAAGAMPPSEPSLNTQSETQQSDFQPTQSQESINANLRKLSNALSAFQRCLIEVEQHIDSARTSIDSAMLQLLTPPPHTTNTTPPPATLPGPEPEPEPSCESDPSEVENENEVEDDVEEEEDGDGDENEDGEEEEVKSPSRSELETLCETNNSIGLKKYMITHLSDINELREQVPKALKLSPNPGRLVLECIINSSRGLASVLTLECLLLMMGEAKGEGRVVEIEKGAKQEAEEVALAWRARMITQGGVLKAHEMDARALLLLIGCFGIPERFMDRDIRYLVNGSGARGISGALRRSSVLMKKIPEIIEWMLKNDIVVGAVDIAYTFGIEERFNPRRILTSFLHNSEVSYMNKVKGLEQGIAVRAGKKKHLSDLKSVSECLERHKIDPSKLLPGWQIDVRIMNLEKDIAELDKHIGEKELAELTKHIGDQKMAQKRKLDVTESLSGSFSNKEMKPSHYPNPFPPQQQRVVNHVDGSNNILLERGGTAGHIYGYSLSPSVLHGTVAGSMHENVVGSLAGPAGGVVAMDGAGAGKLVQGVQGGTLVDHTPGQIGSRTGQLYAPRGDAAVHDRLASHIYAYRSLSYLEGSGSTGLPNVIPSDSYRPPPYVEGSAGLPNTIAGDTYRPPTYLEGSSGLPNTIPAPYQFADTVPATALYRSSGSRAVDAVPSAALAHPSSSLYWKK
ncbi:hypothetical protein K7X08_014515 [Anisodus acutangulus]|uniref:FRIGIDA-like protein n=1 Tax=Anisodus acutangulus TaxID=402998 RepID=A0A9Q1LKD0_9SOLA|nr:hypothetical protein K7X08_014515 [Anisodus acutangulus]